MQVIVMAIQNIIFDMDGTLVDTAKATVPTCMECAAECGLPPLEPHIIRQMIGWANPEFYYRLYPGFPAEHIDRYAAEVEKREAQAIRELGSAILFPGIVELLTYLIKEGYYLAIASTGSWEHVEISLRATGIYHLFDNICCNEPVKVNMVDAILKGGKPGKWLILGDKDKDAMAGRANGILTVGAAYGFGTQAELDQFDEVIKAPMELLALLKGNENG